MKRLNDFRNYVLMLALACLCACAQLGMAPADTFNKKVAAAYTTVQSVADSANAALAAGKITKSDATNVVTSARAALTAIDVAEGLHSTDPKAGDDKLAATLAILQALSAYLAAQGAK